MLKLESSIQSPLPAGRQALKGELTPLSRRLFESLLPGRVTLECQEKKLKWRSYRDVANISDELTISTSKFKNLYSPFRGRIEQDSSFGGRGVSLLTSA